MKDFSAEIRATLDIAHFLNQAVLLMDLTETNLECVVELMLHKMLDSEEPQCTVSEAKSLLFTSDSGEPQSVDIDIYIQRIDLRVYIAYYRLGQLYCQRDSKNRTNVVTFVHKLRFKS